ncbi:MAG TPA: hypothetical protein VNS88_01715 [Nitrospiraceae bacterium]|nr:hypothetical protein [Nitrospiraceae bacterium]
MATDKEKVEKEKAKMQAKAKPVEEVESADYDPDADPAEGEEVTDDQPTASEELVAYQDSNTDLDTDTFEGVTDPVPGAVTEMTPEVDDGGTPQLPSGGWAQLANTDNVADLGVAPGTRVQILDTEAEIVEGVTHDPYHPVVEAPEDGEILVRTRDAAGLTLSVTAEDLEPVTPGASKG